MSATSDRATEALRRGIPDGEYTAALTEHADAGRLDTEDHSTFNGLAGSSVVPATIAPLVHASVHSAGVI
ncbi:hypothetical protein [Actinomadura sp. 9N407]|uniref:hypothetical protein n=1 Tax=Actinomadura sp. 9N407 TaxID=3375154 RepID=UPI0037ABBB49